ncbi:MAG: ADP-ribosylglycohydrolase family protein [Christensenellaceae bacterium]
MPACEKCPVQEWETDIPKAQHGFDAPWSIGAIVIGWLYGEGDFGRSVCIATNLGEDTDCTAGTLGAILGIISGASGLPAKWVDACSDKIATWTIRRDAKLNPPSDISALCERLVQQTPVVLRGDAGFAETEAMKSSRRRPFTINPLPSSLSARRILWKCIPAGTIRCESISVPIR